MEKAEKNKFTPFLKQCFVTAMVTCNVVGQGCLIGFPGVLLPHLQQPGSTIHITKDQASWIAAVSSIAMFFGHFLISPVMERAGRKAANYVVTFVMLIGWITIMLVSNYEGLLAGKVLHGLAFGLFMPLRSVLIGEYTSPLHRGGFLTMICLGKGIGILFVHLIGSITSYKTTSLASMIFPVTALLMTMHSPESPSWLANQGKYDECKKPFIWLRGVDETSELEALIIASKQSNIKRTQKRNRMKEIGGIAKKKEFYKPVILMFAMYMILHFSGGTLMGSYAVTVLNLLMGPKINAHLWMVALDAQRLAFTIVAIYVINRVKRRTMLFATGALCTGSLLAMAGYVYLKTKGLLASDSLWIPGILINAQTLSIAMGMASLPGVIAGEVFPLQHRSLGGSISLISSAGSIFVVLKTFPGLISCIGFYGTFTLYAGIITSCLVIAWFLLPETNGRTLQQIEERFKDPIIRRCNRRRSHRGLASELEETV